MILNKFDKFIIKRFLGTFVFILLLLMSISVVFDLSEKLNELLDNGAPWGEIFGTYYSNFFLFFGTQFSYLINFISVIFFTSKMANNTEIVPVLSAGVSFNRFLRPYFVSSFILMFVAIIMYNYVLPGSNSSRIAFEEHYYRHKASKLNLRTLVGEDMILYLGRYDGNTQKVRNFNLQKFGFNEAGEKRMEYWLKAENAVGDSLNKDWNLGFFELRTFAEFNDEIVYGTNLDTTLSFGISDIIFRTNVIEAMNNTELNEFIQEQQVKGSEKVPYYLIEKHKRWASPFAIIVLTLIGVSLSSQKKRGGLGMNIALGLLLCVLYIFSMQVTTVAATNVGLTPVLAVWLPNIIFSIIAFLLYKRAPK